MEPMPVWIVARFGMRSATKAAMRSSTSDARRRHLDQRVVGLHPAHDLADVDLVATERARHRGVAFEEEPRPPDERGDVVRVEAEAEVPVAVGRRRRGEHQWIVRALLQDVAHLAEVVRHEVERPGPERRTRHVGQEVRDVTEPVPNAPWRYGRSCSACIWCTVTSSRSAAVRLDGVEQRDRLAVGYRQDDVGARRDELEHRIGRNRS